MQDKAIARYEAESASDMLEPNQRSAASKKAVYQRNIRGALNRASEAFEQYILAASQPLQNFPCLGALDVTAQLIPRDESNSDASRRRSSLGWAFARESPIATAIVRKTWATLVAQRLTILPPRKEACRQLQLFTYRHRPKRSCLNQSTDLTVGVR